MSWRLPYHVVRFLCGPLSKPPVALRRTLPTWNYLRTSWFCSDTQHSIVAHDNGFSFTSNKSITKRREELFQPGLFHVDISSFRTDEQVDDRNEANSGAEQSKKRSYINYGTHLDPVVFQQLQKRWVLGDNGTKKEVFHPKLTPRLFYKEAEEYSDTAVIYPQVARKEIGSKSQSKQDDNVLDQFKLETGIGELDLQLLESLLKCSDEFLLGLASNKRFVEFTEFLGERCSQLPTDEFIKVLVLFARVQVRTKISAVPIFLLECENRFSNWNVQTSLLVCDAWRLIGLKAKSLNMKIFGQIEQKADQLTKHQVVQLMYLIGENRYCQENLLDNLQDFVVKYLDSFTLAELGAICQGVFKSKTNLKPSVVGALAKRIQSEQLDSIHSFYLVGILKVFRQAYFGHRDLFIHVADSINPHLHTYPITSIMHILLTYATLHIHNHALLRAGSHALFNRSRECRCKDLSKFLWSFATLNYHPENSERFFKTLIGRMVEVIDEFEDFPVFLVSGLLSLAYLNIYPAELLNFVFSPKFLLKLDDYAKWTNIDPVRDMFLLHCSVTIDCPDYQGNRLSKDFFVRKPFSPRMFGSLPYELSQRPLLKQVASTVATVLGSEKYLRLGFTLPHMKTADIEICLDSNNSPIPVCDLKSSTPSSSQILKDKVVHLDPSLITNLSGKTGGSLITPTRNRTASSTFSGTRTANVEETTGKEAFTAESRHLNAREPQTSLEKTIAVNKLVLDRAALFAKRNVKSEMSSRFDVPEPLCSVNLGGNRIALLVWSRNHFHFNGKTLLGLHSMKRRQLQKLGYQTVEIPFFEWDELSGSEERLSYIRRKLVTNRQDQRL